MLFRKVEEGETIPIGIWSMNDDGSPILREATEEDYKAWEQAREEREYDTWKGLIEERMEQTGDTWEDIEHKEHKLLDYLTSYQKYTVKEDVEWYDEDLDPYKRDNPANLTFTIWTKDNVYYPREYDGQLSVESVPRNYEVN